MTLRALRLLMLVVSISLCVPVAGARAQEAAVETSESLFQRASDHFNAGRFAPACPLFLESYRLDTSKPGALHALAECYAALGKDADAVNRYREYIEAVIRLPPDRQAAHDDRVQRARAQIVALSRQTSELTLVLPNDAPPGTRVTLDGEGIDSSRLDRSRAITPGEHRVTTQVPRGEPVERRFSSEKGEPTRVVLDVGLPDEKSDVDTKRSGGDGGRRRGAIVAFIAGGAGVVVGAVAGVLVFEKKPAIEDGCTARLSDGKVGCRDQASLDAADSAKTLGTVSTIALVGGGVGIALGTVLVLTAPSEPKRAATAPWIAVRAGVLDGAGVGVTVRGAF